MQNLKNTLWPGIVEDNNDPLRLGRIKVRVKFIFDDIPVEDIPWASPNIRTDGKDFNIPDLKKIVNVQFFSGDIYTPEYITAEHYDYTLQKYLENLSLEDYLSFKGISFDDYLQIYKQKSKGLTIDYLKSNININNNGNINLNLRDKNSILNLGSDDADQSILLATNFINWNDTLIDAFLNGGFIGNLGLPVQPSPTLLNVINSYKSDRNKFLSEHVFVTDNYEIKPQNRETYGRIGDLWEIYEKNKIKINDEILLNDTYIPEERKDTGKPELLVSVPNDVKLESLKENVETLDIKENYENGKIPLNLMKKSRYLSKNLGDDSAYLLAEAADNLDLLIDYFNTQKFEGKQPIIFTDGYRTYNRQVALYNKLGSGRAAKPGRSNHGWGLAVDIFWGVKTSMYKDSEKIISAFKHPMYKWFFENGPKFGWFNPLKLRDGSKTDEWWHWEYYGKQNIDLTIVNKYKGEFTKDDINNILSFGGTYV